MSFNEIYSQCESNIFLMADIFMSAFSGLLFDRGSEKGFQSFSNYNTMRPQKNSIKTMKGEFEKNSKL